MSLPALRAVRERFPHARITVAVGKPGAEVVHISGYADAIIVVDRVSLRDGFKPFSILRLFRIVKDVRQRQFDFVIDLHSLSETNLLGFLSGASKRLFSRRPGRSLDFLASFDPLPPIDRNDPKEHLTDRYLAVLRHWVSATRNECPGLFLELRMIEKFSDCSKERRTALAHPWSDSIRVQVIQAADGR